MQQTQQTMDDILTVEIGELVTFYAYPRVDAWQERVVGRRDGITITQDTIKYPDGWKQGQLMAWGKNCSGRVASFGWVFGSATSPDEAIDCILAAERGWAGLARGATEADKWA